MNLSFSNKSSISIGGQTVSLRTMLPIVTILVVFLATIFPLRAIYAQWRANEAAISKEKDQLTQLQTKLDALNGYNDEQLKDSLTEASRALPEDKNVPGLIAGLERLSQENNLQITGLDLRPGSLASASAAQSEMDVQLTVAGDIKNLDAFLSKLAQIRRIMAVTKIDGASSTGGTLSTSLNLAVYSLALPSAQDLGTDYASPLPPLSQASFDLIDKLAQMPVYTDLSSFSGSIIASPSATPTVASPSASASATKK